MLVIAFAIGLRRSLPGSAWTTSAGPVLIGLTGVGLIVAGLFPTDPGGGYPPGIRVAPGGTGTEHDLATLLTFGALVAGCVVLSHYFANRGHRGWAMYAAVSGAIVAAGFGLIVVGFSGPMRSRP